MKPDKWYSDTFNEYRGYEVEIITDEYPENPRTAFDNMGKMICFHRRYDLGDKHQYTASGLMEELAFEVCPNLERTIDLWENKIFTREKEKAPETPNSVIADWIEAKIKKMVERIINHKYLILELYLYDHSGITMRCSPFSDPWDSGKVGVMVMTKEQARQEYPNEDDPEGLALKYMRGEVETYDAYLTGDVFGWKLNDPEGNEVDSCWGYYGFDQNIDYVMSEVKGIVDRIYQDQEDEAAEAAYQEQQKPARHAMQAAARWKGGING